MKYIVNNKSPLFVCYDETT